MLGAMRLGPLDVHRHDDREPLMRRLGPLLDDVQHVIDVGANVGQFGSAVRRQAGFTGRIDSYEPAAAAFTALRAAAAVDEQWQVHHRALSDQSGTAELYVHDDSSLNSLAATTAAGSRLFSGWGVRERPAETVTLARLDDEALPDLGRTLLKLDTQGHDFAALAGAERTLSRCSLLLLEVAFVVLYETSSPAPEALSRLDTLGFGLVDLFPITRDGDRHLLLVEADGLFARR